MKTDKRELLKKLEKNPTEDIYETIIKYCKRNVNSINWNLKESEDKALITAVSSYLMKYKIGKWDSKDAIFMTYFFGNTVAKNLGVVDKVKIKLMSESTFEKKYDQETRGICIYNPDRTCVVIYNQKIVTQLMSKNSRDFINGIQGIAYEMTHAYQNILIHDKGTIEPYNREQYIMALEEAAKSTTEEFYDKSYVTLYKENQAEVQAIDFAVSMLQLYEKSNILEKNEQYIMQKKSACQKRQYELKENKSDLAEIPVSRTELNARMSLHLIPELLEQYPILKIAFDNHGHKKGIVTLLNERKQMLKKADKSIVDELYKCILTETLINGESKSVEKELSALPNAIIGETIQKQQAVLKQYIAKTNSTDKFAKDLLRTLTRRQKIVEQKEKNNKKSLQQKNNKNDANKKVIFMQKNKNKSNNDSKPIQISKKVTNKQQDDFDKKEYKVLIKKLEEARKKGYSNTQRKISAKIKQRSGYGTYVSADSITQPINPYCKDYVEKSEFNKYMKKIETAKKNRDKVALRELSLEMKRRSGYATYLSEDSKTQQINPYFKDYMDKKEFEEHMKKVEEAKRCGDKKMLMALSSEMIDKSGYGIYLSNESKVQQVNSYFKDYMDKI